ncbi:hypothetical protein [Chitiniphilus eburneus]|uniref:Uncharacterized protein n=1 Tax=Chitiniphilus eburneus TaxID=2571148 RepID=A0A4U0PYV9_9NEIS|nr:hypothetical protein [Chitiniphilus eburneus]TJZ73759.1 hypothetical protein FAZ21_09040 [Chitiniphilus eburneus]
MAKDLEFFMANQAEFDTLSDTDKAALFAGGTLEGDTPIDPDPAAKAGDDAIGAGESSEAPDAAGTQQDASKPDDQEVTPVTQAAQDGTEATQAAPEAVVLTRDGKHTIPFSELQSVRDQVQQLSQEKQVLLQALSSATAKEAGVTPPQPAESAKPAGYDFAKAEQAMMEAVYNGDQQAEAKLRAEIFAEQRKALEAEIVADAERRIEAKFAEQRTQELYSAAIQRTLSDHPYLNDNEAAVAEVIEWRDFYVSKGEPMHVALERAAARIAPQFKPADPAPQQEVAPKDPAPVVDVAAKAAEIVAATKPKPPTSLSQVPAAVAAPGDELQAMREMSGTGLIDRFAGKSPDQIMELLSRLV